MAWIDAMLRDGVKAWVTVDRIAADVDGHQLGPMPLRLRRRYLRPADLDGFPADDEFVVLSRATESVLERLNATGRAWAALDGRYHLPDLGCRRDEPVPRDPIASRRPCQARDELRVLLAAMPAATHAEYAAALGITRSRVTQLLSTVDDAPAVRSSATAGHVTRWWSDRDPWDQVKAAYEWLDANGSTPVLGGETAADAVAPWRAPGSTVMHVRKITPPPAGLVLADSYETATMTVVVDYRPSVLAAARTADTPAGAFQVAHPLHIAADLADPDGADERTAEHVEVLLRHAGIH
jgi:hypothetical protein